MIKKHETRKDIHLKDANKGELIFQSTRCIGENGGYRPKGSHRYLVDSQSFPAVVLEKKTGRVLLKSNEVVYLSANSLVSVIR